MKFLLLLTLLFMSAGARGQLAGTSSTEYASHGWIVAQVPGEDSATLVHLPPRVPTGIAMPSPVGRMKALASPTEAPDFLAADGDGVYMLFSPEDDGSRKLAQLSVLPSQIQDYWIRDPKGRFRFHPSLTDADDVRGMASYDGTVSVLMEHEGTLGLRELAIGGWEDAELPVGLVPELEYRVYSSGDGLHIVEMSDQPWRLHTRQSGEWISINLAEPGSDALVTVGVWQGEVIAVARAEPRAQVWSIGQDAAYKLGKIDAPGDNYAASILHSSGRLVLVWTNPGERTDEIESSLPTPGVSNPVRRVIEFSLIEGRPLYTGPAAVKAPVSAGEFRNLALLMMMLMAVVLLVVIRPSPKALEAVLPPGLALAPPGRRFLATVFDGLVGLLIVSRIMDLSVIETLGPLAVPATGRLDLGPLSASLMVNVLHGALSEALFGRSIGKTVMGLIVARVDQPSTELPMGQFRPPSLLRSFGRNLIKWLLPPVSMLALSDPNGRHRGDLLARSAVLCRAQPPLSDH